MFRDSSAHRALPVPGVAALLQRRAEVHGLQGEGLQKWTPIFDTGKEITLPNALFLDPSQI